MPKKLSENIDSIGRIKFLMEYDVMKTLSENVLTEQIEASKVPNLNQLTNNQKLASKTYGPVTREKADEYVNTKKPAKNLLLTPDEWLTDEEKSYKKFLLMSMRKIDPAKTGTIRRAPQSGYDYFQRGAALGKMDAHDWFTYFQVLAVVGGIFTGGLTSAIFFISAAVLDLAEAFYFWKVDKDPYMASIMAIFAVIPDMGLMEIPGLNRIIQERGKEGIKQLIKKNKDGLPLTPDEIKDLKFFNETIIGHKNRIQVLFRKYLKEKIMAYILKQNPKWIMNFLLAIKFNPLREPIKIGSSLVGFDYLYAYVFRDDIEKMQIREQNILYKMAKYVKDLFTGEIPIFEILEVEVDKELENAFKRMEEGEMNFDGFVIPNEEPQFEKIIK